ncbi:unnamed protein product, partial [Porites evermanni]
PLECYSYSYLNDSVRAQGFYNGYYGYYQCDSNLPFGWYRFSGSAGSQMATSCVGKNRCSSHAPGWLSTPHPSKDDGIFSGTVCFHWDSSCCLWSTNIRVRNCSGFYVYELGPPPACWLRYCGNGGGMLHLLQQTVKVGPVWQAKTKAGQIAPSSSSEYYVPSSSYALPPPLDFQFHVPADCDQICTNTQGSYSCSCVSGYRLSSDGKSCLDIDECSTNNGGCSHHCYNIPGSFYCGCPEGTTMASNNLTCVEPGVSVVCDENNMTVSLEKQTFPFFNVSSLHLRYSSCRATENSTHFLISTPLNSCGTLVNETEDALIFWNEIRADAVIIDNVITRTHDITFKFYCSYSRRKMLSIQFQPQQIFIGSEAGYGNFTFKMDFYKTAAFATPYAEKDYPILVALNEYLYVKYSVESSANLVIMAENCKATKYGSFYSWPYYNIIQNGCEQDTTMEYTYNPLASSQQLKIRSFRFFNDYDVVYFHCELLACYRGSSNSRCSRGCLSSKRRKRRGTVEEDIEHEESTSTHILSSGPIMIKETETETEERDEGDTGKSQQTALIGGAAAAGGLSLIVIIALAVLAVKYRIARRFMNRNKVGDLYTTQDEQMSRRNAYIQEDDMIEREDSF